MNVSRLHVQLEVDVENALWKHDIRSQHCRKRIASWIIQPRVIQAARRIVQGHLIAPWRAVATPMEHWRRVVEQSVCGSNRRLSVALRIPGKSKPRRKF